MNFDWEKYGYVILIISTFAIAFLISTLLRKAMTITIKIASEKLRVDPTKFRFLKNSISFIIYTGAIIFISNQIPFLKSLGTALFAGAGVLAAIIGFASQKAFSNIIAGIFLLIFKPFKINDVITLQNGSVGVVEDITLRHTVIRDYENKRIVIPNHTISDDTIVNNDLSDEKIRKHIEFGISYDSDIDKAMNIIREEVEKHPHFLDNRTSEDKKEGKPPVVVRVVELADFSVNLRAYVWTKNFDDSFTIKCDLLKSVKQRFDKEGIEIPFPYHTIVYKKDLENE